MEIERRSLIPVTLEGSNYLVWSRLARVTLGGHGLWDSHIMKAEASKKMTQEDSQASGLKNEDKWVQEDMLTLEIIQSSLSVSILEAYSHCESAKELWESLQKVYGNASNLSQVFKVKQLINNLSQDEMEFNQFFGKFSSLWAELDVLRPSSVDPEVLRERQEQDRVFSLLLALNPSYNSLIKHILRGERLPSLEDVCCWIQREHCAHSLFKEERKVVPPVRNMLDQKRHKKKLRKALKVKKRQVYEKIKSSMTALTKVVEQQAVNGLSMYSALTTESNEGGSWNHAMIKDGPIKVSDIEPLIKAAKAIISAKQSGTHSLVSKPIIIDSGASHHMISDRNLITDIRPALGNVTIANGDRVRIEGIGNLKLFDRESTAFYMPGFASNLLSVKKATVDLNCQVVFRPNDVEFQDLKTGKVIGEGNSKDGLYHLQKTKLSYSSPSAPLCMTSTNLCDSTTWHARLGHPHSRALGLMMPDMSFSHLECEACILGKHCRSVFPASVTIYEKCFDLIHSDVWTSPCLSRDNHKYFVTFIDEKSKYTWITLLPSKDRVLEAFMNFQSYVTNHFKANVKVLRSDNGGEYTSHAFKSYLAQHGIVHQTSCPYTPQQNGVAERKNRHLMEVARSMMFHANVPKRFWSDAVVTACYLINRIPTKVLKDISPYEVLNQNRPSIHHLRVFGCACFVLIPREQRDKLEAKSMKCMFIGYSPTQKGYKCYNPETRRVLVSRDVKFMEEKWFYAEKNWDELKDLSQASDKANNLRIIMENLGISLSPSKEAPREASPQPEDTHPDPEGGNEQEPEQQQGSNVHDQESAQDQETTQVHEQEEEQEEPAQVQPLRRSTRVRKDPSNWVNTRVYFNSQAVAHPTSAVCSFAQFPSEHQAFIVGLDEAYVPRSYEEAMELEVWRNSVGDEIKAMITNDTWYESELPKGKKAVSSKWVFTIKFLPNGKVERCKTRLVARGFTQTYGEDYVDTFAPVAKLHTIRILLSLATNLEWELWQMDVKNAFLQGELEDEVYMHPPPGLEKLVKPGNVLRLKKAIYGLKQSPRAWYHKLSTTLNGRGFRKSEADHTLFTLTGPRGIVVILIYVDDIIITGSDKEGIKETKVFLKSVFDIKDLGELKYFLGIEVCRSKEGLFLSQRKYTLDLLTEAGNLGGRTAKTPLEEGYKVLREGEFEDKPYGDVKQYRRMVGKLIYLTITRPDICFAVNQVSQHMQAPKIHHWNMVKRIMRYLREAPGQGVWMACNGSTEIVGYCDADWAGDRVDRRSTTGYCTFIGGNLVTWKSKKQKVVSCSSAEAEYRAMRKLTNELIWIKGLLGDLGVETTTPITIHCDNQAAIHIASNSVFHERTKHIEVDCHKVRQAVEKQIILPCYTRSEDQLADIFTKAASTKVCEFIHSKLGLIDLTSH